MRWTGLQAQVGAPGCGAHVMMRAHREHEVQAVPRAVTELMNGRGCLWFTPAVALQSEAMTEDTLVAEIVARSEPMW